MSSYIVLDKSAMMSSSEFPAVVAPTGYYRTHTGEIKQDNTPSPEMGPIQRAYRLKSHRAAARVASKLANAEIRET